MELIERYLQAVQFWLPRKQKDDIIAELSEDLHAQIEDRETALGRSLTEAEVGEILKRRGRPVLVANRFVPQQHLIGPVLFPIYTFVLKIVLLSQSVPWALTLLGRIVYSATYRAEVVAHPIGALLAACGSLWSAVFFAVSVVTLVFAVLERAQAKSHFLENWDPRKLPAVRNPNVITRPTATFELIFNLAAAVVWATAMYKPVTMIWDVRISVSPLWPWFFWGFLVVALGNATLSAFNLMRPYWTIERASLRLLADAAGSALFCWLMKANILAGFTVPNVTPERAAQITNIVNYWMGRTFPIAVAIGVAVAGANIYRIVRLKTTRVIPRFEAIAH